MEEPRPAAAGSRPARRPSWSRAPPAPAPTPTPPGNTLDVAARAPVRLHSSEKPFQSGHCWDAGKWPAGNAGGCRGSLAAVGRVRGYKLARFST